MISVTKWGCCELCKNICKARLKTLKVLANNGYGVGIPVLRTMYIRTIRAIIDYAAPVLMSLPQKNLHALEVVQNEAMGTILGCTITIRIEVMRMELNLASTVEPHLARDQLARAAVSASHHLPKKN